MTRISAQGIAAASATDVSKVREQNEDASFVDAECGLFIVSDRIGGAQAGALASQIVVKALPQKIEQRLAKLKKLSKEAVERSLREAIAELSRQVQGQSADKIGLKGMGATAVLTLLRGRYVYIAHMGDSRAYLLRKGRLKQLTEDHSIIQLLIDSGEATPEQEKTTQPEVVLHGSSAWKANRCPRRSKLKRRPVTGCRGRRG